ncbi:2-oxo-hepta-3-ene-1,7-dioate hydratase [Oceanicola sp. D3]|uniref:fumarylacetoacetate hydrolase family protein n=1 Tax=Oceanicola sp. D3 TaxID=2587163 RepID=UPI00111DE863|nr:fumarylacetoacetate hydrolase family protein [Oceanicola sp. D3]QDC10685.1 2-oxo-hepta-3-ene-1,7-dioate hydratase [Oceanicola sp. D3]
MLTKDQRAKAVASLLESHRTKVQGERPSAMFPEIELADSYAISSAVAEARMDAGHKIVGHKIGLTSKAMQAASKIDEPDFGYLFSDQLLHDGAKVPFASFCKPRVEPELTFVLHSPLKGPGVQLIDVLRATEWVIPSIEIIDARVTEPRQIFDTVADNGAGAGIVLGGRPIKPDAMDLRTIGAIFYRNSEIEETGLAAGVLGHPAMAIAWLANKLGPYGTELKPGDYMLSGSFTRPVHAQKGDTLHADFGPLGSVAVQFT